MPRRIVCLTFDFDAVSIWIARGLTTPTPMSRGEFGLIGARRILALLKKYDIRSTWFIPATPSKAFLPTPRKSWRPVTKSPITAGPMWHRPP
jgi:peptidoglycan/xylan/chitin deacetylase (PgdA/CDA1 family)